jgi:dihydrofolate reductase
MRNVVSGLFVSLDGVAEAPDKWQFDHFDEGMFTAMTQQLAAGDTVLMGRVTYQEWSNYWPNATQDVEFGNWINNAPKYVASKTLDSVQWGTFKNISLVKGSLADEVAALKRKPGKDILVTGSPGLVRSMVENDLLDKLILMIHPVIAGQGRKHLFGANSPVKRLKLVDSTTTPTGVIIATYVKRDQA